jgi:hypothetical protein
MIELDSNSQANDMHPEIKTIFFQTELILPPMREFRLTKAKIRSLYARLHEPGGYPYDNIETHGDETDLSTKRDESRSVLHFCPRHIRIEEDQPLDSVEGIIDNVKTVLERLGDDFPPFVLLQRCRFHCLARPQHVSSTELLADRVANVYTKFMPLGRSPSFFGIRFRFLPMSMLMDDFEEEDEEAESSDRETPDTAPSEDDTSEANAIEPSKLNESDDAYMTLRFETYSKDISYVWMEASAEFRAFNRRGVFTSADIDRLGDNIGDTYRFLSERCIKFLDQWDVPRGADGG